MSKLSISERLSRWKSLRKNISKLDIFDACALTSKFWNNVPFVPYYLQLENPETWPDPWQLLVENYFCDIAKCLGIIYTLYLSDHSKELFPELRVYFDTESKYTYHIAYFCHGKYVLNLVEDEIVNKEHISQRLKLTHRYTITELKLEQY